MKTVIFNYVCLKDKISKKFGNQNNFANAIGISYQELSSKLNNKTSFTQEQIYKCIDLLSLNETEILACFFNI
ncbi:MAG: DUF739 family protein [Bacilli bacterium]|nr:DUF739 family protein [Bacilli bacterium]